MVRSEYKKGTASDSTNIHTPENKTVADNPSCHNNDPARDNPRIRQRSNSTKSQERERERERERARERKIERREPDYPTDDLLDFANTEGLIRYPWPLVDHARRTGKPRETVERRSFSDMELFRTWITKELECWKSSLILHTSVIFQTINKQ